jgi:hypothetical protein
MRLQPVGHKIIFYCVSHAIIIARAENHRAWLTQIISYPYHVFYFCPDEQVEKYYSPTNLISLTRALLAVVDLHSQ